MLNKNNSRGLAKTRHIGELQSAVTDAMGTPVTQTIADWSNPVHNIEE